MLQNVIMCSCMSYNMQTEYFDKDMRKWNKADVCM